MSDIVLRPSFPESEIEREKAVQIAGIKAENDQLVRVAIRQLRQAMFGEHPYANMRNGTEESVSKLGREQAATMQKVYGTAGNGVLAIYGAIDPKAVEAAARRYFQALPAGNRAFADPPEPRRLEKATTIDIPTDKQQAVLVVGYPGVSESSPDHLAMTLIEEACSDMSSRLFMRIREEMGLAYYVSAAQLTGLASGAFLFYLGTDPNQLTEVQQALENEIAKLVEHGLEEQELARAKKTYLGKLAMEKQSLDALGVIESAHELYGFGHQYLAEVEIKVQAIDLAAIRETLMRRFHNIPTVRVRISPGFDMED